MRIAVLSDIHDNVWKLQAALTALRETQADALICCGDLCSPFVVGLLKDEQTGFPGPIHVVFGNNDADLYRITQQAAPGRVMLYGELAEFVVEEGRLRPRQEFVDRAAGIDRYFDLAIPGPRVAVNHFDYLARPMAASGQYAAVFYGHNHHHRHERLGGTDVINPGAIMGYNPTAPASQRSIPATYVIYDTTRGGEPEWYEIVTAATEELVSYSVRTYRGVQVEDFKL